MSPAKDLGKKHTCWKCETRFYDLHKAAPVCPKCGADQRDQPTAKSLKEAKKAAAKAAPKKPVVAVVDETVDEDALPEEEEDVAAADDDDDEP